MRIHLLPVAEVEPALALYCWLMKVSTRSPPAGAGDGEDAVAHEWRLFLIFTRSASWLKTPAAGAARPSKNLLCDTGLLRLQVVQQLAVGALRATFSMSTRLGSPTSSLRLSTVGNDIWTSV